MTNNLKQQNKAIWAYTTIILVAMCVIRNLSSAALSSSGGLFLDPVSVSLHIPMDELTLRNSFGNLISFIFLPIAGKLASKYSLKLMMIVAIIAQALGFISLGFTDTLIGRILLTIPTSMGAVILINLSGPLLIDRWFRSDNAKALAILMAFYGIFGAFIQPLIVGLITNIGWRQTYILVGAVAGLIILLFIVLFIKDYPLQHLHNMPNAVDIDGLSDAQALKSPAFYTLLAFIGFISAIGVFTTFMDPYGIYLGYSKTDIQFLISTVMIGTTVGSIVFGLLAKRFSVLTSGIMVSIIASIAVIGLALAKIHILVFYLGAFCLGMTYIGYLVLAPIFTAELFGHKNYSQIYADVMMGKSLASMVCYGLYSYIYDSFKNYNFVIILLGIFAILAFISIIISYKLRPDSDR